MVRKEKQVYVCVKGVKRENARCGIFIQKGYSPFIFADLCVEYIHSLSFLIINVLTYNNTTYQYVYHQENMKIITRLFLSSFKMFEVRR